MAIKSLDQKYITYQLNIIVNNTLFTLTSLRKFINVEVGARDKKAGNHSQFLSAKRTTFLFHEDSIFKRNNFVLLHDSLIAKKVRDPRS